MAGPKENFVPKGEGAFEGPPPGAPIETAQPLSSDFVQQAMEKAQKNERTLAPLAPPGPMPVPALEPPPPLPAAMGGKPEPMAPKTLSEAVQALQGPPPDPDTQYQPAASDTDSPSRGVPRPIEDPYRAITGGFGNQLQAQYNPLNGLELKELIRSLMDQLNGELDQDLRLHISACYPRLNVQLSVRVSGYFEDASFTIAKKAAHEKTPEDVAQQVGQPIDFTIDAGRREFDAEGNAEAPPDYVRDELGLPKPQKQWVGTGPNRQVVDSVPTPGGIF